MVVLDDIAEVVSAAVVGLAYADGVVGEVDVAVVACEGGRVLVSCDWAGVGE